MKKNLLILFIVMLAALLCFAACNNDPTNDNTVGVKSIEIVKGSVPTQVNVGDPPDFSRIIVKVVYEDTTSKEVGYSDVTISAVDTATAGKKTVTVTYEGVSTTFEVNVVKEEVAATVTSIKIVPGSINLDYYIGQIPDYSTLQVEATYSDGTVLPIKADDYTYTPVDTTTSGEKTFTVTYNKNTALTDSAKITVAPISSITVITGSVKNKLNVGETLDTSAIQVAVEYENGKGELVEAYNLTVGKVDTTTHGKKTLSITYKGITIEYPVEVVGMVSLTVNKGSYPETLKIGGTFAAPDITAKVTYSDGTEKPLTATDLKLSAINTNAVGEQSLTVSYSNAATGEKVETTVKINVIGVKTLTVSEGIANEILKGNALDLRNVMANVEFTDGTKDTLEFADLTFGRFDTSVPGDKTISITYLDKTIEYAIRVCDITSLVIEGVADSVPSGKPIDITGMKVYGVYNDSKQTKTAEPLNKADYTTNIEKLNTEQINSTEVRTLIVTYGDVEGTWTVYTTAPELVGIEIDTFAKEVLINGEYNKNSVTVIATYGNGTTKTISASALTIEIATNIAGNTTLTVTYEGKTDTKTVKVCTITHIVIKGVSPHLPAGEELDLSSIEIWGVYNNTVGNPVEIRLTAGTYTSNKADIDGNKDADAIMTLQVTYTDDVWGELNGTFAISAQEPILERIEITKWDNEVFINDKYNKGSVVVTAYYGNGTSEEITTGFVVSDVVTGVAGDTTLTVTYEGKTDTKNVTVFKITSLIIEGVADSIASGKPINIDNIKVYGVYNDTNNTRTPEPLNKADYTTNINELNANVNGTANRVLEVTYTNGAKGTLEINVTAPEMTGITITAWDKTIGLGGVYNTDSIIVNAVLGNGTTGTNNLSGFTVSKVVTSAAGKVQFTVTYTEGGATYTATATVEVLPISHLVVTGVPSVVNKGEVLDTSKIKVTVYFTDGSSRSVNASNVTISTPDTSSQGNKTFTVTYLEFEQSVSYHVRAITSVKILSGTVSKYLRAGYEVDTSGLWLEITYSNGDTEQKKASELTDVKCTGTGKGSTQFTVKYQEFTDSVALTSIEVTSISAINGTIPKLVMQGTDLDFDTMKLTVYYSNGEAYLISLPKPGAGGIGQEGYLQVDYRGVNTKQAGEQAISFYYSDGISINHGYDALLASGAMSQAQYDKVKHIFDTSYGFTVRGITKVEVVTGSVYDKVFVGTVLDTSKISAKVTYDDGNYIYVNRETGLTVKTIDTSKEGTVKLEVVYSGVSGYMDITVEKKPETMGVIVGVLLPDSLVARESYKNNFIDVDEKAPYYVGDDNPFYFYLDVVKLNNKDEIVEEDGSTTRTEATIYLVGENGETKLEGDNLTKYVAFDSFKNSYDFTEDAIGKTFRLEIHPVGYSGSGYTKSHTVTVVDGYNVYKAWELNIMTNINRDITQECFGTDGKIMSQDALDEFFATKPNFTRPENVASLVLHGNLDVTVDDIPKKYLYPYTDSNGVEQQGFYNQLGVFHRELTKDDKDFNIYGNFFSVYSYSLPCVVPNNVANNLNDGGFSSSALFKVTLSGDAHTYIRDKKTAAAFSEFKVNIQDISTRDNDPNSNDQSASERHMRGLSCYKLGEAEFNLTHVNAEAYMTSVVCEYMGSTLNLNKVKLYNSWQTQLFLWNENAHQLDKKGEDDLTWDYIPNLVVNINDSEITKCGGPVIFAQAPEVDLPYNRTCGIEVHADADSKIHTYVTGQEAWFVAVGQTQLAAAIRAMSPTIGGNRGFTSTGYIQGVETVNMIMVAMGNRGTTLNGNTSNVLFTRDDNVVTKSHHPDNTKTFQTTVREETVEAYILKMAQYLAYTEGSPYYGNYDGALKAASALRDAPLFETNTGGLGYIDASMKCNDINNLHTGDYITLYYTSLGASITMDYYYTNNP